MTRLFIWGTLTTAVNGGGRRYFDDPKKQPVERRTIQGVEGEIYEVNDEELARLDAFETNFSYIKVNIEPDLLMYVKSPITDYNYWKNIQLARKRS